MKKLFLNKKKILLATLILLPSLAPLIWLKPGEIIYGPDTFWSPNTLRDALNIFSTWKEGVSFGYGWPDMGTLPHYCLVIFSHWLGLSETRIQQLVIGMLILLSLVSMFTLVKYILNSANTTKNQDAIALTSAYLYVVNPIALTWVWWRFLWVVYIYPLWPIVILIILRALHGRMTGKQIILTALLLSAFGQALGAIIMLFVLLMGVAIFSMTYIGAKGRIDNARRTLTIITQLLGLMLLLNLYWIVPQLTSLQASLSNALTAYDPNQALMYASAHTTVLNSALFIGFHVIHLTLYGESYYGNALTSLLHSQLMIPLLALPLVVLITSLFTKRTKSNTMLHPYAIASAALFLVGLFFVKGANRPFEQLNIALLKLPLGAAFRLPYDKFCYMLSLSFSLLAAISLAYSSGTRKGKVLAIYIGLYVVTLTAIFMSPTFLPQSNQRLRGVISIVPKQYQELRELNLGNEDRMLILPPSNNGESSYIWPKGAQPNADDTISSYTDASVVFLPNGNRYSDNQRSFINNDLFSGGYSSSNIDELLLSMGINYIFIHKDWNDAFMSLKVPSPAYYLKYLDMNPSFKMVRDNEYYSVYEIQGTKTPIISSPELTYVSTESANSFAAGHLKTLGVSSSVATMQSHDGSNAIDLFMPSSNNSVRAEKGQIIFKQILKDRFEGSLLIKQPEGNYRYKLAIDGKPITKYETLNDIDTASVDLMPGEHVFSLTIANDGSGDDGDLKLLDPSFEDQNTWAKDDWECYPDNKKSVQFMTESAKDGKQFLRLISNNSNHSCIMGSLGTSARSEHVELVTLNYRTNGDARSRVVVLADHLDRKQTDTVASEVLPSTNNAWGEVSLSFKVEPLRRYRIFMFSELGLGNYSSVDFDNVRTLNLPTGYKQAITLASIKKAESNNKVQLSNISHPSHDKYSFNATNLRTGSTIVLMQAFDPRWSLYIKEGSSKVKISDANHFIANGVGNGWSIGEDQCANDPCTVFIRYDPQEKFVLFGGVSLFTFGSLIIILVAGSVTRSRKIYLFNTKA